MKAGDTVRVKVVGLGALRRAWHDTPAVITATHDAKGRLLARWEILWDGERRTMPPDLLSPLPAPPKT